MNVTLAFPWGGEGLEVGLCSELGYTTNVACPFSQVIPTPSHLLDRISPILPPFFPFFARFHRLAETVPTSPKPEPRAKKQPARVSKQQETPFLRAS